MQNESSAEPEQVMLLPSHLFFVRNVALPAGIKPDEITSFVEVSLEQISPFSLNQLYYGYYLPADSSRILIYAAYRKKLEIYEDEAWANAELVLPDFSAVLGLPHDGPTLCFLQDELEVTAVYWEAGSPVPDRVLSRMLDPGKAGASAEKAREELRQKLGTVAPGARIVILEGPPRGRFRDRNLSFDLRQEGGAEGPQAEIPRPAFWPMDVRDKSFLAAARKAQRYNRWLWYGVVGLAAAFLALAAFEAALFAGRQVLEAREKRVRALEPEVARVVQELELAERLEELTGQRLLPFEMLGFVNRLRPRTVHFTRVTTNGLSLQAEAVTPNSGDVQRMESALDQAEGLESVDIGNQVVREGRTTFRLSVTFQESALSPAQRPEPAGTAPIIPPDEEVSPEEQPPGADGEEPIQEIPLEPGRRPAPPAGERPLPVEPPARPGQEDSAAPAEEEVPS